MTPLYFFVIQDAFEVANRLLEAKDGLGLWGEKEVELEALSNKAIILALQSCTLGVCETQTPACKDTNTGVFVRQTQTINQPATVSHDRSVETSEKL